MKCSISTYYKILDAELYDFDDGYMQLNVDIDTKNIDLEEYVSMQKKSIADMCNVPEGYGPECWNSLTAHYYRNPVDWENYRVPGQMNIEDFLDMGGGDNGDKKDMPRMRATVRHQTSSVEKG